MRIWDHRKEAAPKWVDAQVQEKKQIWDIVENDIKIIQEKKDINLSVYIRKYKSLRIQKSVAGMR